MKFRASLFLKQNHPVHPLHSCLILLSLLISLCLHHSRAAESQSAPPINAAPPEAILSEFKSKWEAVKDYTCKMDTTVTKGKVTQRNVIAYAFKRPNLWRNEVLEGKDEGGAAALGRNGKVRAHGGGVLSVIKVTMDPEDKRLLDLRGARADEADFGSMVRLFEKRGEDWNTKRLPDETLRGRPCFVIERSGKPNADGETRQVLYFDTQTMMLRASKLYEGSRIVDDTYYDEVKLNANLDDSYFVL